jgi:phthalate 4,5-dioxygenase oxygenase subunit
MAAIDVNALTRVGPNTPTYELMRQYWLPAAKSSELEAGGAPLRLLLLGERLIAFRDVSGELAVMDHRCPHRGASLFYGRNEEGGIRCAYHGWKFDRSGACVDLPNLAAGRPKPKISNDAYQVAEGAGIVWVYMGPRADAPPLPIFAFHDVEAHFVMRKCNWLQALEGDTDTSHVNFLHLGSVEADHLPDGHPSRMRLSNRAPEFQVADTDWGVMAGAYRDLGGGKGYWGVAHFLFPFWAITATDMPFSMPWIARAWVPMDDEHVMTITLMDRDIVLGTDMYRKDGTATQCSFGFGNALPNTTDWYGRWRVEQTLENDHLMDRDAQRNLSFTGIEGILMQDQAITESMGPIVDRSREHLIASDNMIVKVRRSLQRAAQKLIDEDVTPPGVDNPGAYYGARGGVMLCDASEDFVDFYMKEAVRTATFKKAYAFPVEAKTAEVEPA